MGRAGRSFMPSALQGLESTNIISAANEVSNPILIIRAGSLNRVVNADAENHWQR